MRTLHKHTIEALRHKAAVAEDSLDANDPETGVWVGVAAECNTGAASGTVEALAKLKKAQGELEDYIGGDLPDGERKAIVADLCRAGWYDRHDADVVSTRRMRTMVVDGTRYVVG